MVTSNAHDAAYNSLDLFHKGKECLAIEALDASLGDFLGPSARRYYE